MTTVGDVVSSSAAMPAGIAPVVARSLWCFLWSFLCGDSIDDRSWRATQRGLERPRYNTQRCSTPSRSRFSSSRARPALCFVSNIVKLPELFVSNILVFVQPLVCIVIVNVVVLYCIVLYLTRYSSLHPTRLQPCKVPVLRVPLLVGTAYVVHCTVSSTQREYGTYNLQ